MNKKPGRVFAVGDIQGCLAPLQRLLDEVHFDPSCDRLWCAGDLVNRGPDSLGTLRFLYKIKDSIDIVLGNHDLHLLAIAYGEKRVRPDNELLRIAEAPDSHQLLDWLRQQPLLKYDQDRDLAMCHAGIPHIWTLDQALKYSKEVQTVLKGGDHKLFYRAMYGNEPNCWKHSLKGMKRLRVITNYFTRMRFVGRNGELDLESKEGLSDTPKGYIPWFEHKHQLDSTTLIFGHWAALEGLLSHQQFIGLDTGCVWGGHLTMIDVDTRKIFQSRINSITS